MKNHVTNHHAIQTTIHTQMNIHTQTKIHTQMNIHAVTHTDYCSQTAHHTQLVIRTQPNLVAALSHAVAPNHVDAVQNNWQSLFNTTIVYKKHVTV